MNPPRRPPGYIRLINDVGNLLERMQFAKPDLYAGQLIRHAQRRTGLQDWGDESFRAGLEQLTTALQGQARLSQIGRITAYLNTLDHLCVRLRLIDYRARRPEVGDQQIKQPLFILGLPRTGTTILHELLAQDPAFRSPASWEVTRPVPPPTAGAYDNDRRIAAVDRLLALLEKLCPGFMAIHALGARLPQECVYILASGFISEQFGYLYNVPAYRDWALGQDMTASYRWHAHFLQHLQVDFHREHWALKTPAHLAYLKYLLAQYPDATIVWTHRRPLNAIASFSSLAYTLRRGFSSSVDPVTTGQYEFQHFAKVVHRGMQDRRALDTGQFIDVNFNAICADPMSVIRAIYEQFDLELSGETTARMCGYLRRHPRGLHGEHRYTAAEFGLNEAEEGQLYGDYLAQYGTYLQAV
ncbi:MAG TPA: sulfotransferase [Halioglobus sp.]